MRLMKHEFPKPRWGDLYVALAVLASLLGVVEFGVPEGLGRTALEVLLTFLMFGAMLTWIHLNRLTLTLDSEREIPRPRHVEPLAIPSDHALEPNAATGRSVSSGLARYPAASNGGAAPGRQVTERVQQRAREVC